MTSKQLRQAFLAEAASHVGYQARSNGHSTYAEITGHAGMPWAGAFVDVVARNAGIDLPSHVQTAAALANFQRTGRLYNNPRPGDIAFFNFSSEDAYGMPHCGIVTDVDHFARHGMFQTIEGQTASGTPKGGQVADGVYKRTRYAYDVIGFARPKFKELPAADPGKLPTNLVKSSIMRPGLKHPQVQLVQLALAVTVGLRGAPKNEYDHKTQRALAAYQREIGFVGSEAEGVSNLSTLQRLGAETGYFTVVD